MGSGGRLAVSRKESQHSRTAIMVLRSAATLGRFPFHSFASRTLIRSQPESTRESLLLACKHARVWRGDQDAGLQVKKVTDEKEQLRPGKDSGW